MSGELEIKHGGGISKRELELALENQRLEFEKHLLENNLRKKMILMMMMMRTMLA